MDPIFASKLSQKLADSNSTINMSSLYDESNDGHSFSGNGEIEVNLSCFDKIEQMKLIVQLRNVRFSYNRKDSLIKDLNVNIPAGQIYGLLGPSECGKSTTLKLILGLIRPQKGHVYVYGSKPNSTNSYVPGPAAGYMPQDLALMPTMTIADHFNYYGQLNGMTNREIGKRSIYLVDLLQIPAMDRPIEKLSGGQQRRTSLALTLLHSPSLLILDEPTVGIDPVLRNKIWQYLHELTIKENKTVIITTHYIEEARNAHTIALMRYGRLLAEANPDRLLSSFNMNTIEDVFLNLCEKEDSDDKMLVNGQISDTKKQSHKELNVGDHLKLCETISFATYTGRKYEHIFSWIRVMAIIIDSFTFMRGKFFVILITCLLPTMQIFLFHYSIGKPVNVLPIAVTTTENRTKSFSNLLIDRLEMKNVQVSRYQHVEEAVKSVKDGLSFASFEFKANFTKCLINRIRKGVETTDKDINCSQIRMWSDNTYQFNIFQIALELRDSFYEAIYQFFPKLGYHPEALNVPVVIKQFIYGNDEFSFQEFMTPGMYMALIYLAPLIVTMFILLEQKVCGHVERAQASGARPTEILAAHFITNTIILLIQTGCMMVTSLHYFEAKNYGSLILLVSIVFQLGIAGICLAILMAVTMNNKLAALVSIYGLTISLWMICGVFWPIENITIEWGRWVVMFLPLTLPIETARNIMNRGWSYDHQHVLLGFMSNIVYTIVPLMLAYFIFKSK